MQKAVLLVTFNRLEYLKEVFSAISKAKPPRLYLASDGPRPTKTGEKELVNSIREWMLGNVNWPCEVKTRFLGKNSGGCGPGVSGAVTWFFQNEKDGIILEDDCVPSQTFFRYCEECLDKYADDKRVWHIAGTSAFDIDRNESYYFSKIMHCWGWASWADRWRHFSLHITTISNKQAKNISKNLAVQEYWKHISHECELGRIETWDYQWAIIIMNNNGLCIIPCRNMVSNIGDFGVHYSLRSGETREHRNAYDLDTIVHPAVVEEDLQLTEKEYRSGCLGKGPVIIAWLKLYLKNNLPEGLKNSILKIWRMVVVHAK